MSDQSVAAIARLFVEKIRKRARTQAPEDDKAVFDLQTRLAVEVSIEELSAGCNNFKN